MYARDKTSRAVPCWLIFDDRYRKRYAHQRSHPGHFPTEAARERQAEAGVDAGRPRQHVRHRSGRAWPRPSSASTSTPQRRRPRLRAGRVGLQPVARRPATARCTPASARSTRRRTTRAGVPGDIGTCGGLVTDEHAGCSTSGTSRSPGCTRPATAPPPSWAATTSARAPASPTAWCSAIVAATARRRTPGWSES